MCPALGRQGVRRWPRWRVDVMCTRGRSTGGGTVGAATFMRTVARSPSAFTQPSCGPDGERLGPGQLTAPCYGGGRVALGQPSLRV